MPYCACSAKSWRGSQVSSRIGFLLVHADFCANSVHGFSVSVCAGSFPASHDMLPEEAISRLCSQTDAQRISCPLQDPHPLHRPADSTYGLQRREVPSRTACAHYRRQQGYRESDCCDMCRAGLCYLHCNVCLYILSVLPLLHFYHLVMPDLFLCIYIMCLVQSFLLSTCLQLYPQTTLQTIRL